MFKSRAGSINLCLSLPDSSNGGCEDVYHCHRPGKSKSWGPTVAARLRMRPSHDGCFYSAVEKCTTIVVLVVSVIVALRAVGDHMCAAAELIWGHVPLSTLSNPSNRPPTPAHPADTSRLRCSGFEQQRQRTMSATANALERFWQSPSGEHAPAQRWACRRPVARS